MTTFIRRFETSGTGIRLAVKDLIDMEGVPTTAGCRALAERAQPAERDAACLAGARAAGVRIVGRTNLHELALGVSGVNPWYGTPINPLDPSLVPGGSSSGSAVAVTSGEAEVAFGTDSGGSVRIPAACCGVVGLKTTFGRIPLDGVRPLAPSLDTVGPMAQDVSGLFVGMELLEPGFRMNEKFAGRVGRLRVECDPLIDAAIDRALAATGWEIVDIFVPEWDEAGAACGLIIVAEAWQSNRPLAEGAPELIGEDVLERLRVGRDADASALAVARGIADVWRARLSALFEEIDLLATPTITIFPPPIDRAGELLAARSRCTLQANLSGVPALALPVPTEGSIPASLQLMAPWGGEESVLAAGLAIENACATILG